MVDRIKTNGIEDDAVTNAKIAADAVDTDQIADGAVETAQIADNDVTNAKLAQVATETIKGRLTAGTGNVEDLSASDVFDILGITSFVQTLLDDADADEFKTTLNAIGVEASDLSGIDGYVKFTNGLMIQWCYFTFSTSGSSTAYPVAFDTDVFGLVAGYYTLTTAGIVTARRSGSNPTTHFDHAGNTSNSGYLIAIGN